MTYYQVILSVGLGVFVILTHVVAITYADDYVYSRKYAKEFLIRACVLTYAWVSIIFYANTSWDTQVTTFVHGVVFVSGAAIVGYMFVTFGLGFVLLLCITLQTYGELWLFAYDAILGKKRCV